VKNRIVKNKNDVASPVQSRSIETRETLFIAAEKDFSQRGYSGSTTKTIVERSGLSVGIFYRYFQDKDTVFHELVKRRYAAATGSEIQNIINSLKHNKLDYNKIYQLILQVIQYMIEQHNQDPGLHRVITERRFTDKVLDKIISAEEDKAISLTDTVLQHWGAGKSVSASLIYFMIEGSVHGHVFFKKTMDDEAFCKSTAEIISSAIFTLIKKAGQRYE